MAVRPVGLIYSNKTMSTEMKLGVMLLLQRRIQAPAVMVTNLTEREAIVARLITVKW